MLPSRAMAHGPVNRPETRDSSTFQPYVPASRTLPEFTVRAVILGALFGLLFGASTVYLGLRAGLTVGASIPIAVLSISVLKRLRRAPLPQHNTCTHTASPRRQ